MAFPKTSKPDELRKAIKQAGLPYDIIKIEGSWYVTGGDSVDWHDTCLYYYSFKDGDILKVVEKIKDMEYYHKEFGEKSFG